MSPNFTIIVLAVIMAVVAIVFFNVKEVRNAQPTHVAVEAPSTAAEVQ